MEKIILRHKLCPGDVIAMTALVRDLALAHPGRYDVAIETNHRDLFANNPYGKPTGIGVDKTGRRLINLNYGPSIGTARHHAMHFMWGFHRDFRQKTNTFVPPGPPHPDLHLSEEERLHRPIEPRYWLVFSGGKSDATVKHPHFKTLKAAVQLLQGLGIVFVQAGGASSPRAGTHTHPPIPGVIDMIGKTSIRQALSLIHHADGVICPITFAMHAAAALHRPCVVVAGGREEWWWEGYVRSNLGLGPRRHELPVEHRFLHTIGLLDCCRTKGCWKSKITRAELAPGANQGVCVLPVQEGDRHVPLCHTLITPERIVEAVLSYYHDGTLPPLEGSELAATTDKPVTFTGTDGRRAVLRLEVLDPLQPDPAPPAYSPPVLPELDNVPPPVVVRSSTLAATAKATVAAEPSGFVGSIDDPILGGRVTICVHCYGSRVEFHRRSIAAVLKTVPSARLRLRIFCNAAAQATVDHVKELERVGRLEKAYFSETNINKYPAMRQMFWDPALPLSTNWLLWFEDDTFCDIHPAWFQNFCDNVASACRADPSVGAIGPNYFFPVNAELAQWIRSAAWHRGRGFRDRTGKEQPGADKIHFITGSCLGLKTEAIRRCDIPDARVTTERGDVFIGEQLWQHGYRLRQWNAHKKIVIWSGAGKKDP
jgi:hypothetical protein